jgi:putative endonuclease
MWSVYILYSKKDGNLYVGCSENLNKRIKKHNLGMVPSTKDRRPLVLIHYEKFEDKKEAFKRERFLKSLWAGRFKKKIKQKYLESKSIY